MFFIPLRGFQQALRQAGRRGSSGTDADFEAGPEGTHGAVVDDGVAIALDFNDGGRLVGSLDGQAGEAEGEFVLRKADFLAGFEDAGGGDFGLEAADGDDRLGLEEGDPLGGRGVAGPELLVDVEGVAAAGVVGVGVPTI